MCRILFPCYTETTQIHCKIHHNHQSLCFRLFRGHISSLQLTCLYLWHPFSIITTHHMLLSTIIFEVVDPFAFINPLTVYVYGFGQSCDCCAEAFLADTTDSLSNHVLHINTTLDAGPMIAERTAKNSIKLIHSLLRRWLCSGFPFPHFFTGSPDQLGSLKISVGDVRPTGKKP